MSFRYFSSWIDSSSQLGAHVYVFYLLLSLWFLWSYFRVALNWRICDDWVDHFALVSYRYLDALQSINMDLILLCTIDQVHLLSEGAGGLRDRTGSCTVQQVWNQISPPTLSPWFFLEGVIVRKSGLNVLVNSFVQLV